MGTTGNLLDTNAVIDYLDGKLPAHGMAAIKRMVDSGAEMSVISKIEVLRFQSADAAVTRKLKEFVDLAFVYQLDDATVDKTIEICRKRKIKLPDAIIGATALLNNLAVVTRNVNDFKHIDGLAVLNPWEAPRN